MDGWEHNNVVMRKHIAEQEERAISQQKRIDLLQHSLEDERQNFKQKTDRMQLVLDQKELYVGIQGSDDDIFSKFTQVLGQIKTWSHNYFGTALDVDLTEAPPELLDELGTVAPNCRNLQQLFLSRKMRIMVFRGWVAQIVTREVFRTLPDSDHPGSHGKDWWMEGRIAKSVYRIENYLHFASSKSLSAYK